MKEETPNEVANKILNEYLEGKSFGFIKQVCSNILSVLDNNVVDKAEIQNQKVIQETLLSLHQLSL